MYKLFHKKFSALFTIHSTPAIFYLLCLAVFYLFWRVFNVTGDKIVDLFEFLERKTYRFRLYFYTLNNFHFGGSQHKKNYVKCNFISFI